MRARALTNPGVPRAESIVALAATTDGALPSAPRQTTTSPPPRRRTHAPMAEAQLAVVESVRPFPPEKALRLRLVGRLSWEPSRTARSMRIPIGGTAL